jgi:hypothetical protein
MASAAEQAECGLGLAAAAERTSTAAAFMAEAVSAVEEASMVEADSTAVAVTGKAPAVRPTTA